MPIGVYDRKKAAPRGSGRAHTPKPRLSALRNQLLALGAEQMYRKLRRELDALRKAYPGLARFDLPSVEGEVPATDNGHQANPAPGALQLFQAHKAHKPAKRAKRADLQQPRTRRSRHASPVKAGTLTAQMIQVLKDHGPLTAKAVASTIYATGTWKPATDTEQHRADVISVMLRQLVTSNRKLVKVAGGKGTSTNPRLYAAY